MMSSLSPLLLLERDLSSYERKLNSRMIRTLARAFQVWLHDQERAAAPRNESTTHHLLDFLKHEIQQTEDRIHDLRRCHADFQTRWTHAASLHERRQHILHFARELGASRWQLRGDRRAFQRWFDRDAVGDRYLRLVALAERKLAFCLQRLGVLAASLVRAAGSAAAGRELWEGLGLEKLLKPLLAHEGDNRVRLAAFRCLAVTLRALAPALQERTVAEDTLAFIYRAALDPRQDVWIQCEALVLLQSLSSESLRRVLHERLRQPAEQDDMFVRRQAVRVLGQHLERLPELAELVPVAAHDPCAFVRQGLAQALLLAPADCLQTWLRFLARADPVPQVRAAAIHESRALLQRPDFGRYVLDLLLEVMAQEGDPLVLRVAMDVAADGTDCLVKSATSANGNLDFVALWRQQLQEGLARLQTQARSLAVRRWASQARERIWCATCPEARALRDALSRHVAGLKPGRSRRLPSRLLRGHKEAVLGRVLSVLAQDDFGYDLERHWWGTHLTRGPVFRFRLWRLLHELRHPSPDKRQAFPHTTGRVCYAQVRAPSTILCELAETKVPGEPLYNAAEDGWRPYLPLLDDVLSSLNQLCWVTPVRFYTSAGVTRLTPPRSPLRRVWAYLRIVCGFAGYARLRNWNDGDQADPAGYLQALGQLGFALDFHSHDSTPEEPPPDASVTRFFALAVLLCAFDARSWLQESFDSFWFYFTSVLENSVTELIVFTALALVGFCGRHWYANHRLRRTRARLRLVIGGWGTRGKSGTERLKAALFNALGYNVVAKTTGCEAMFLHAYPYNCLREMFLFRSYDKATIWEQTQMARLASALGAEVFLWECMGLQPSYVRVLQREWMKDDLSTITNAYPDHEDIQGPAGIDIPRVMAEFIPQHARLLTSEEQMRPILKEAAAQIGTSFRAVGWREAGLLAPEVLRRFPYEEHPYNIALVLALAEELGVDRDFALKEMADRVVPDLGALKTYEPAALRGRRLEFTNGMSANERLSCLGNWTRLGFDGHEPEREPDVWISTLVNNRADRIPRSRVFAGILANDLQADRHFLIGGNLSGLQGYLREAWQTFARTISLWTANEPDPRAAALRVWEKMARRLRQPIRPEHIQARLRVMLAGLVEKHPGPVPESMRATLLELWSAPPDLRERLIGSGFDATLVEALVFQLTQDRQVLEDYTALAARIRDAQPHEYRDLDRAFHALLQQWFEAKFVAITDYYATGDEILDRIVTVTPPGFRHRIMGIQNIKGTGLDFVYRWEAWQKCQRFCFLARSTDPAQFKSGLEGLVNFQEHGLLSEELVRETLGAVKTQPLAQREEAQAQLQVIQHTLDARMSELRERLSRGSRGLGWLHALFLLIEAFLDAGEAVRRRKKANQIYRDLVSLRISHERAAQELQSLNNKQKGGWLREKIETIFRSLAKPFG